MQTLPFTVTQKYVLSTYNGTSVPSGQVGGGYLCHDETDMSLKNDEKNFTVESSFEDMRVEPFVNKTEGNDFGNG